MKKEIVIGIVFSFILLLGGCTNWRQDEKVDTASYTESGISKDLEMETGDSCEVEDTNSQIESKLYYVMTYTKTLDINELMKAILTNEKEWIAFEKTELTETTSKYTGMVMREGKMTVDGIEYSWAESNGVLTYSKNCQMDIISVDSAEMIARDFLERLGWEYNNELKISQEADGSVEIIARLCYDGIKIMGDHTLFFERGNEHEVGLTGAYISMVLSGDEIVSMQVSSVPHVEEIIQTFEEEDSFLTASEIKKIVINYFEMQEGLMDRMDLAVDEIGMDIDRIYMPYRDITRSDKPILIPAYEVYISCGSEAWMKSVVLYVDAVTGYVYDRSYGF